MQDLPPGWSMKNSTGSWTATQAADDAGGSDMDIDDPELQPDSPGWEDLEDDSEAQSIVCLFCMEVYPSATAMIEHCRTGHSFDFASLRQQHGLDFYSSIKFVNYIRSQVADGNTSPDISSPNLWADDKYLTPTKQDDALLFNLDDLLSSEEQDAASANAREYGQPLERPQAVAAGSEAQQ